MWHRAHPRLRELKRTHVNAFPAVHLRPMNLWDYIVRFSSDLIIVGFAAIIIGLNWHYLTENASLTDASHLSRFLHYHTDLNPKYYAKNVAIKTTVLQRSGFISEAQANGLTSNTPESDPNDFTIREGALIKPNPDSMQMLISKQIKVYKTQAGDTIGSISKQFNISANTILWANNLTSTTIKPDWDLIILPTDGVLHKAGNNDTLPDLARRYGVSMESIIAYNGLDNAEDIEPGQIFIVKNGKKPTPVTTPIKKNIASKGIRSSAAVGGFETPAPADAEYGTGHEFPWGYCTYYVSTKRHIPWGGNAKQWLKNAKAMGASISDSPVPGSILVATGGRYGHVALVESVSADSFTVSEMNYEAFGKITTRTISKDSNYFAGFILP